MTHPFPYGTRELNYLSQADADFATVIAQCEAEGGRVPMPRAVNQRPAHQPQGRGDHLGATDAAIWQSRESPRPRTG